MSSPKKLNIHVRPLSSANALSISAREKAIFHCAGCKNKYYAFHYFCPECLGIVMSDKMHSSALRLLSYPAPKHEQLVQLIEKLSGKKAADVARALTSLPRILFDRSATEILEQWEEILRAEEAECEIIPAEITAKQKTKRAPLFLQDTPLPVLMTPHVERLARATSRKIGSPAIRMKWVEAVTAAFRIFEDSYKRDPNLRVLFPDFLYKIEEQLFEAANEFDPRRGNEEELLTRTEHFLVQLREMESEIRIVRNRITQQL